MDERSIQILESLVGDFINFGEPVSSRYLCKLHDFGVKEATVRNELNHLVNEGYLAQPHISSGRVPTDKGYLFFVERVLVNLVEEKLSFKEEVSDFKKELSKRRFKNFIEDIADELGNLGVGYSALEDNIYKSGLGGLFDNLLSTYDFNDPQEIKQIVRDFEALNEKINSLLNFFEKNDEPKVFIGKSPITKSRRLSVVADVYDLDGDRFVLAVIGPKQMDYFKNIKLLKALREEYKK